MKPTIEQERIPSFAKDPESALKFYFEHGYQIEPDVWSAEDLTELKRAAERLSAWQDGSYTPAMNPHRSEPVFLKALRNPKIVGIMEKLVRGRVSGLQTEFFFCRPGTKGFAMHQDNYYVESKPDAFASAWSPLVDVAPKIGGLTVYPGTHREPILPVEAVPFANDAGQDKNANRQQCVVPKVYQAVDVIAKAGSVVFIHGHIVHSSHANETGQFRLVLLNTYLRNGEAFRPGFSAKRNEVDMYSSGPAPIPQ